jgi:hypothetical protein
VQASLFKYQLILAFGAFLTGGSTVLYIAFKGTLNTIFPCVDALRIELKRRDELYYKFDRHLVAQHT